jgi:hypothetical protein
LIRVKLARVTNSSNERMLVVERERLLSNKREKRLYVFRGANNTCQSPEIHVRKTQDSLVNANNLH